jgi:hypothetical protein
MTNAGPFSISTLQEISNDTKNTSMRGVLGLDVELWTFGSPGGLQILIFSKCWASPPHLAKVGLQQLNSNHSKNIKCHITSPPQCKTSLSFHWMLAVYNGKNSRIKNYCACIHTTKSRCVVNWFFNLLFMKVSVENVRLSSTFLWITIVANSTSFRYSNNLCFKTWLICNRLHIWAIGL